MLATAPVSEILEAILERTGYSAMLEAGQGSGIGIARRRT